MQKAAVECPFVPWIK